MNKHMLKKREQYYLIEQENQRMMAYPNRGGSFDRNNTASADFGKLLRSYPKIDYNNKRNRNNKKETLDRFSAFYCKENE